MLISIQNDREFERLCHHVIDRPGLEKDPDYATAIARNGGSNASNRFVVSHELENGVARVVIGLEADDGGIVDLVAFG